MIVIFTSSWVFSVKNIYNRKLKVLDTTIVMVYHSLIGFVVSSLLIFLEGLVKGGEWRFYTFEQYCILIGSTVFDAFACFSVTGAYQSDASGFVSLLGYSIIIYGFLFDVIIFNENIMAL